MAPKMRLRSKSGCDGLAGELDEEPPSTKTAADCFERIMEHIEKNQILFKDVLVELKDDSSEFKEWLVRTIGSSRDFKYDLGEEGKSLERVKLTWFPLDESRYSRYSCEHKLREHLGMFLLGRSTPDQRVSIEWPDMYAAYVYANPVRDDSPRVIKGGQRIFALMYYCWLCYDLGEEMQPHMRSIASSIPTLIQKDAGSLEASMKAIGE